jgi:hypothetical protein
MSRLEGLVSSEDVISSWAAIEHLYDPIAAEDDAKASLHEPARHTEGIEEAIKHIDLIDTEHNGVLSRLGYDFCRETRVWRTTTEAVLQARALQQIAACCHATGRDDSRLARVVVRHTFDPRFHMPTPSWIPHPASGLAFIVMPFVYQEILLLTAKSVVQFATGSSDGNAWAVLEGNDSPDEGAYKPAPPALRQFIARLLTAEAFDPIVLGENPFSRLRALSPWFAEASETVGEPTPFEISMAYSAQDFSISHELGHSLTDAYQVDAADLLQIEMAADEAGFGLYAVSWGWRDEILESTPLSQAARIVLGPLWFYFTATMTFTLMTLVAARVATVSPANMRSFSDKSHLNHIEQLARRWQGISDLLNRHTTLVKSSSGEFREEDEKRLARLVEMLDVFASSLQPWVASIPETDLLAALSVS